MMSQSCHHGNTGKINFKTSKESELLISPRTPHTQFSHAGVTPHGASIASVLVTCIYTRC